MSNLSQVPFPYPEAPSADDYMPCIKCGLCLQSCPTYQLTGEELESPRGRVQLIAAVGRGVVPLSAPKVDQTLFDCLDCRACEVACPSGVPIGKLIEAGRAQVIAQDREEGDLTPGERLVMWLMRHVFPFPDRLARLTRSLGFLQRTGLVGLSRWLPAGIRDMAPALPPLPEKTSREMLRSERLVPEHPDKSSAGVFLGCVMDTVFANANRATVRVLTHNGHSVVVPAAQRCCGALAVHAGDRDAARALARANIDAFLDSGADVVVTNAGGCGAALLEYPEWLRDDAAYAERAQIFAAKVRDVSQLLVDEGFDAPERGPEVQLTYQESCHLSNVMRASRAPRAILSSIPNVNFVEMPDAARCCGSAGIYNLTHPEMSEPLIAQKMQDIPSGTEWVVTGNPGCWLQLLHGRERYGPRIEVLHTMEVLDKAYAMGETP